MPFSKQDITEANRAQLWTLLPESCDVKETRKNTWAAKCWLHDDHKASVAIWLFDDGGVVWKCYGCSEKGRTIDAVMGAFGLNFPQAVEKILGRTSSGTRPETALEDLGEAVETYDYTNSYGEVLYQIRRYEPKAFRPWHMDGGEWKLGYGTKDRTLFWRMVSENKSEARVYLVEGEKDVERLFAEGAEATTWAGGADAWRDFLAKELVGVKEVVCIPDRDAPGHLAMRRASLALMDLGVKTGYVLLNCHDVSDYLEQGLPMSDLESDIVWDTAVPEYECNER